MSDLTQADIAHALDLAVGDVHQPGALGAQTKERDMSDLSTDARKALPDSAFALPAKRKFPIHDASHVRNAAARYAQNKAEFSPAERKTIERNLARAKKRFGIDAKPAGRKTRVSIKADLGHGGMLHVRHLTDGSTWAMGDGLELDATALADKDAKPVWIQLAKVGAFRGHAAGPFELTPHTFAEIVANFRATQNRRIPIDFEHASEADPTEGSIPVLGAPAQGWIVDLDNRGEGGLWGLVEWGSLAREYIQNGQYRFFSPAIRFNSKDRTTGKPVGARMTSGALTNNPFLDGLKPLAAKDADGEPVALTSYSAHEFMPRIKAALSLHPLSPHGEVRGRLDALRDGIAACGGAPGMHQGVDLMSYAAPLRTLANLPATASWPEIIDVIEDLIDAAMDQHIEEMHGGQEADEAGMSDDEDDNDGAAMRDAPNAPAAPAQETTTMANPTEDVIKLNERVADLQKQIDALTTRALKAEASASETSTRLSEAEAKNAKLEGDNKRLMADHAKWEQAAIEADVDEAIANAPQGHDVFCKDKRSALIAMRAKDPDTFAAIAPKPVDPKHRHLLRDIATGPGKDAPQAPPPPSRPTDIVAETKRLMKDEKLSYEDAFKRATKAVKGRAA